MSIVPLALHADKRHDDGCVAQELFAKNCVVFLSRLFRKGERLSHARLRLRATKNQTS